MNKEAEPTYYEETPQKLESCGYIDTTMLSEFNSSQS